MLIKTDASILILAALSMRKVRIREKTGKQGGWGKKKNYIITDIVATLLLPVDRLMAQSKQCRHSSEKKSSFNGSQALMGETFDKI